MTLENCDSCLHPMREHNTHHRCPRCGATKPKEVYSSWHGRNTRASLYPNHTSTRTVLAPGFIKLALWVSVMVILVMALAALSDPVLQSIRGGV